MKKNVLLAFLLITITLFIAVSIYCYLIKYRANQKHLLPFNFKKNKFKKNYILRMSNKVKELGLTNRTYYNIMYIYIYIIYYNISLILSIENIINIK